MFWFNDNLGEMWLQKIFLGESFFGGREKNSEKVSYDK